MSNKLLVKAGLDVDSEHEVIHGCPSRSSLLFLQRALMESRICLLHAGATGCETLKNLVLPGCGFVCVVDAGVVTERDAKNNFFTPVARLGEPRARVALETLLEMNEDVRGEAVIEEPSALIASQPDFFSRFTLVVASQMRMSQLVALESVLTPRGIPFIVSHCYLAVG